MPQLKSLSGEDVVKILSRFGFEVASHRGSHAKLSRMLPGGKKQTLTVPRHRELDKGTLRAVFRQALRYIPEEQMRPYFYAD